MKKEEVCKNAHNDQEDHGCSLQTGTYFSSKFGEGEIPSTILAERVDNKNMRACSEILNAKVHSLSDLRACELHKHFDIKHEEYEHSDLDSGSSISGFLSFNVSD